MLFQVIPIGQNSRFAGAYGEALSRAPAGPRAGGGREWSTR